MIENIINLRETIFWNVSLNKNNVLSYEKFEQGMIKINFAHLENWQNRIILGQGKR